MSTPPPLLPTAVAYVEAGLSVIPIAAGLDATRDRDSAPQAVMGGMVRLFVALALIELASLAVKYA